MSFVALFVRGRQPTLLPVRDRLVCTHAYRRQARSYRGLRAQQIVSRRQRAQ